MPRALCGICALAVVAGCALEIDVDRHSREETSELYSEAYEDALDLGKADSNRCSGIPVPDNDGFDRRIALTFDDGPDLATTPEVLDLLRREGIPATFFINGRQVAGDEEEVLLAEIAADPLFHLGNHGWSHASFRALSPSQAETEIDSTTRLLENAGEASRYFRFPYGSANCRNLETVTDRGYIVTGWTIDSADWCFESGGRCAESEFEYVHDRFRNDMVGWVQYQAERTGGGILLFHDVHRFTVDQLSTIITRLRASEFSFTGIDDVLTFPKLNAPPTHFIGETCDADGRLATCADLTGTGFCLSTGLCSAQCEGTCPDRADQPATFCIARPDIPDTGYCVVQPAAGASCPPGTTRTMAERFIGTSSTPARSAEICQPVAPAPISSGSE